jgi:O-antigen ligase
VAFSPMDLSKVLKAIGVAGLVPILLGISINDYRSGRLELSGGGGSVENSNDFAALLILVLPALGYLTLRRGTNIVFKIFGIGAIGVACYLILGTGSRGALVSMILSTLYVLKAGSGKVRMAILVGLPLLILITVPFLPGGASQRLASLFNSKDQTEESAASQEQRTALLMASLKISALHPLLGVGPGTFSIYEAQEAESIGKKGMWHDTHNTYTQVSSECGIPALIFFLAGMAMTFSVFRRGMKSLDPTTKGVSKILALMLVSFSICMFFLSQAYAFGFPVMGGIAISLDRLLRRQAASTAALPL